MGESGKIGAAGIRGIASDIAYDAVVARSVCAVNSFVIFLPLAGDIRPAAVRLVFEDNVVALALGVDGVACLIAGVDERVVIERAALTLGAPGELDIFAVFGGG